jgi:hypothetical protein
MAQQQPRHSISQTGGEWKAFPSRFGRNKQPPAPRRRRLSRGGGRMTTGGQAALRPTPDANERQRMSATLASDRANFL